MPNRTRLPGDDPLGDDECVVAIAPLFERAVIVSYLVVAEQGQREESVRRTDATLSVGGYFLVRCHTRHPEHLPKLRSGLEFPYVVVGYEVEPL